MSANTARIALAAVVLSAAGASPVALAGGGAGPTIRVASEAQFAAAVSMLRESGGTIVLRPSVYRELVIPPRSGRRLRVAGAPGARVGRILLDHTRRVTLSRLTVAPVGEDAWIHAEESAEIALHHVRVTAAGTRYAASVMLPRSRDVRIWRSEFTHCGDRAPAFVNCIALRRVAHLTIEESRFHDCLGCDFVHGRFGRGLTLRGNRFERALPCRMDRVRCGHQDLVELFAGRGLVVEGNHFGVYRIGGAQLYLTNRVDRVRIRNNLFVGTDPRVPGYRARVALIVGSRGYRRVPHGVQIVNNTILTGATRVDGYAGSIRMSSWYGAVARRKRPILANNVIGLLRDPRHVCSEVRASVANVVLRGQPCSRSDRVGAANVDARGRPTAASRLLVDRGSRRYAPATDITGRRRDGRPDIGAFEYPG